jgi:hypothetical protein
VLSDRDLELKREFKGVQGWKVALRRRGVFHKIKKQLVKFTCI